ncbi:hypothetical protein SUBVAR_06327 [Subdoligranulum variabile DSM 15176]|uniref:Uncharacterized protein n=1 Tax=Subdoligranulum variabile DSM 15176 TaxID=411471 RepID=D1PPL0_9FIRM|nr:hypothetical protein SUBVAR_06327 [Subdoligranulum variabile DSM 15176]
MFLFLASLSYYIYDLCFSFFPARFLFSIYIVTTYIKTVTKQRMKNFKRKRGLGVCLI